MCVPACVCVYVSACVCMGVSWYDNFFPSRIIILTLHGVSELSMRAEEKFWNIPFAILCMYATSCLLQHGRTLPCKLTL